MTFLVAVVEDRVDTANGLLSVNPSSAGLVSHPLTILRLNSKFNYTKLCNALVHNIFNWSQRNFAHVTTITLLWHAQYFVVNGWGHFKPEHCKFLSNFEFDQNTVSGTGTWYICLTQSWSSLCLHIVGLAYWCSARDYAVPSAKYARFCWWTQKYEWHL